MTRGIRQGCPISALLFILSVEILGLQIRQQRELKGIDLGFPDKRIREVTDDLVVREGVSVT